ncbi:MAG: L,D-transpeptidase family protein [Sphingomonas sp.]|nr:L,D-transpeptidase family protein [Sphingomonas sp.]
MTLKRVLVVDGPFRHGDYVWDEDGVPDGEVIITVDIKAQTIAVFRAGYQIGAAVILYGADDYPTPIGTFPITQKKVHHISNLYNAPMPYMMRLTNDGVAIHASEVEWGNATHGCIGVPLAFAKLVFAQAKLGTKVIITSGKMMAVPQGAQMAQAGLTR